MDNKNSPFLNFVVYRLKIKTATNPTFFSAKRKAHNAQSPQNDAEKVGFNSSSANSYETLNRYS